MPTLIGVLDCENAVEMLVQDNATAPEACSNCRRFMLMGSPPRVSRHSTRSERHYKNRAAHYAHGIKVKRDARGAARTALGRYARLPHAHGAVEHEIGRLCPVNALPRVESGAWADRPPEQQIFGAHRLRAVVALHGIAAH